MITDEVSVVAAPLGPVQDGGRAHGVITVARRGPRFTDEDRGCCDRRRPGRHSHSRTWSCIFRRRQAVTDELTGLANHGRFHEVLGSEMQQVRRCQYPVALIMLDIDSFKAINDTYGHQQGDVVLTRVAGVLQDNSRAADSPARYGGEELALIRPHTELEGGQAIAERVREGCKTSACPG